jgi:type IV pilus assembly protein PilE
MITIALISVLAAIAIPLYNGYILEGHLTGMRTTMNGMRTLIEEYRLENGDYGPADADMVDGGNVYDWEPTGDTSAYTFSVTGGTTNYSVTGSFNANTGIWVRCDDRFSNCCDSEITGSATPTACP